MDITDGDSKREAGEKRRGRKPGRRTRSTTEMRRDARAMTRLRLFNHLWTHEDVADEINALYYSDRTPDANFKEPPLVGRVQVSRVIEAFEKRLDDAAINDVLKLRRIRIAEYRELEQLCYERYKATIGEHVKTISIPGKNGGERTESEELSGERGYLELAERCKWRIAELENIIPPKKVAPTNPDGTKPFSLFSDDEELKRLASVFSEIGKKAGS